MEIMVQRASGDDASPPLVSVIITSYNYGRYIKTAIESVLKQTYPSTEIIVVDDGSTDDTAAVVSGYSGIRYFFHQNRGVSASRNAGIAYARGAYIVFLDADDWLESTGIEENVRAISPFPSVAFVSGNYKLLRAATNQLEEVTTTISGNAYTELLKRNYIGMLAAVLFRKSVLEQCPFDESVHACEDYDLYLSITRKFPVLHQQKFIATYYFHSSSLSHRYRLMIDSIQQVIRKQSDRLRNEEECQAYLQGLEQWTDYETLAKTEAGSEHQLEQGIHKPAY